MQTFLLMTRCSAPNAASQASSATPETSAPQAAGKKTFSSNQETKRWYNAQAVAQTDGIEAGPAELEVIENEAPVPARKSLFSERQMESIRKTGAVVDEITRQRLEAERIAEEKRKAEEAERKRKEAERQRQIKEAQERKEALERQLRARAWRCNAYGAIHPGGPNECADPSRGGQWI